MIRSPWTTPLVILVATMLLIGAYVGAYFGTVMPLWLEDPVTPFYTFPGQSFVSLRFHRIAERFFAPVHWIDRRLRPEIWESETTSHP